MAKRSLRLRREPLTELTTDDLAAVVGGHDASGRTCPVAVCVVDVSDLFYTCGCNTAPCL